MDLDYGFCVGVIASGWTEELVAVKTGVTPIVEQMVRPEVDDDEPETADSEDA